MQQLDVAAIRTALRALAQELAALHERGELLVVGGAAMALLYGARPVTKDVDVYIAKPEETEVVRRAARRVAEALGLPDDWLNDGAKGFIHGLALGDTVFQHEALTVRALAPEQLLAMKLCAWRDAIDFEDAIAPDQGGRRARTSVGQAGAVPPPGTRDHRVLCF